MDVQIRLSKDNPLENALIKYLKGKGPRSGVPKQLLLTGFEIVQGRAVSPSTSATIAAKVEHYNDKPKGNNVNLNNFMSTG